MAQTTKSDNNQKQKQKLLQDIRQFLNTEVDISNVSQMRRKYNLLIRKTHPDRNPDFKDSDVPKLLNNKKQQITMVIQKVGKKSSAPMVQGQRKVSVVQQQPGAPMIQGQRKVSVVQQQPSAAMTQGQATRQTPSTQLKDVPIDTYLKALLGVVHGFITGVEKPDKTLIDFKNPYEAEKYLSYYYSVYDANKKDLSIMDRISLEKLYKTLNSILVSVRMIAELKVERAATQKLEKKQQINNKIKALQANLPSAFKGEIPVVAAPAATTQAQTQPSIMDTLTSFLKMPEKPVKSPKVQQPATTSTSKKESLWKRFAPRFTKPTTQKPGQKAAKQQTKPGQQQGALVVKQQQKPGQQQGALVVKQQQKPGQQQDYSETLTRLFKQKQQQKPGQQQGALVVKQQQKPGQKQGALVVKQQQKPDQQIYYDAVSKQEQAQKGKQGALVPAAA